MLKDRERGFTLIELVLVITVLGILAVAALPQFINVSTQAKQASMAGVVGAARSGIALFRANDLVTNGPPGAYPAALDGVATGAATAAAPFFTSVLQQGVADGSWAKGAASTDYVYTISTGVTCTYAYTPATGALVGTGAGGASCP